MLYFISLRERRLARFFEAKSGGLALGFAGLQGVRHGSCSK